MADTKPSPTNTLISFFALYLTTLFSLDAWAAARASPYRAPSATNTYFRPAATLPAPGSYQAGMHGWGNAGPGSGGGNGSGGARQVRQVRQVDGRAPLRMGGSASCGACAM